MEDWFLQKAKGIETLRDRAKSALVYDNTHYRVTDCMNTLLVHDKDFAEELKALVDKYYEKYKEQLKEL